jgi:hypothetical protein
VTQNEWQDEVLRHALSGLRQAELRVGSTGLQRLSWLLEVFIQLSPERAAELPLVGEIQLAFEVSAFAGWSSAWDLPRAIELAPLANEIRNGVEELQRNTQWTIELPEHARIKFKIEPRPKRRGGHTKLVGYQSHCWSDDFRALFLLAVVDVLEAEGMRIRRCGQEDCGRLFARHRRAKYCSSRCSQKERDARFRNRLNKTDRRERRHQYYKNQVARTRGRGVASKVKARPVRPSRPKN